MPWTRASQTSHSRLRSTHQQASAVRPRGARMTSLSMPQMTTAHGSQGDDVALEALQVLVGLVARDAAVDDRMTGHRRQLPRREIRRLRAGPPGPSAAHGRRSRSPANRGGSRSSCPPGWRRQSRRVSNRWTRRSHIRRGLTRVRRGREVVCLASRSPSTAASLAKASVRSVELRRRIEWPLRDRPRFPDAPRGASPAAARLGRERAGVSGGLAAQALDDLRRDGLRHQHRAAAFMGGLALGGCRAAAAGMEAATAGVRRGRNPASARRSASASSSIVRRHTRRCTAPLGARGQRDGGPVRGGVPGAARTDVADGATLPLVGASSTGEPPSATRLSLAYGINTAGGVVGTIATGSTASACSAPMPRSDGRGHQPRGRAGASRSVSRAEAKPPRRRDASADGRRARRRRAPAEAGATVPPGRACVAVAASGAATMALEVLWFRALRAVHAGDDLRVHDDARGGAGRDRARQLAASRLLRRRAGLAGVAGRALLRHRRAASCR